MTEIVIPILNTEFQTIVCWGDEKFISSVLQKWGYTAGTLGRNRGKCFHHPERHPVIALPRRPVTPDQLSVLAHEAVHAVDAIFRHIGEKSTGEVFAYSVGAVVRETLLKCRKKEASPTRSKKATPSKRSK
jgi:hypothetical protein